MFEAILERVLKKFLGEYFDGFNSQNLSVGIWGGNVEIANVSLKAGVIDKLELPLEIKYSHVGSLKLKVPWKSIGSSPVEVELDEVFLILSMKHPDQWIFQDYAGVIKKLELIESFKEQCISKFLAKSSSSAKDTEDDQGYLSKMVLKIIDNIQIKVTNIHIRFEDQITNRFSWGIAMNSFEAYTCDENWKKRYIDRTQEQNKNIPLQKQLRLSNLGAYWIANENQFFWKLPALECKNSMEAMIIPDLEGVDPKTHEYYSQYILLLNLESKLYQNKKGDYTKPEFRFELELRTINLALENLQLKQIINMAEMMSLYQNRLAQNKRQKITLGPLDIETKANRFRVLYLKCQQNNPKKDKELRELLTPLEYKELEDSISGVPIEVLMNQVKLVVKDIQQDLLMEEQEKKKKGSWFGWGKKKEEDALVKEEERKQIEEKINTLLAGEEAKTETRPPNFIWLDVDLKLTGGYLHITKQFITKREGVQLYYEDFQAILKVSDASTFVNLSLDKIAIDLTKEPVEDGKAVSSKIQRQMFMLPLKSKDQEKFLDLTFQMNPSDRPTVDKYIRLRTNPLQIVYNPIILIRLKQFSEVTLQDDLKSKAWDQVEQAQDYYAQSGSEQQAVKPVQLTERKIMQIDVQLAAPVILVPFSTDGGDHIETWFINLGVLKVQTPEALVKDPSQALYDEYDVQLQNLTFKYFQQIGKCKALLNEGAYEQKESTLEEYSLIQNFDIRIMAKVLRGDIEAEASLPKIQVNGQLPSLDLYLQPSIYEKILKIGDCFTPPQLEDEENQRPMTGRQSIEQATTSKQELMKSASKVAPLLKRSAALKQWTKYTAVLSGGYIYLFAKPKDPEPEQYVWVRNSDFEQIDEKVAGIANAFQVKNKYADIEFATEKPEQMKLWIDAIEKIRTLPRKKDDSDDDSTQSSPSKKKLLEQKLQQQERPISLTFLVGGISLKFQNDVCREWMALDIQGLRADVKQFQTSLTANLKLQGLFMYDSLHEYLNPAMKYVLTSDSKQAGKELISITLTQTSPTDPSFKGVNMAVDVQFGTLQAVLKPLVVAKLLVFVTPKKPQENILPPEFESPKKKEKEEMKKAVAEKELNKQNIANAADMTLMQINLTLESVNAILVHRFTNLPLAELNIEKTTIEFVQKQDEMVLNGSLGNLQLVDLSNYPNTLDAEADYALIKPFTLLGVRDSQQSLLNIYFRGLKEGSRKIDPLTNETTFVKVKMSQIIVHHKQQAILRILDFTLQQLLFALSNPEKTIDPSYDEVPEELVQQQDMKESFSSTMSQSLTTEEISILRDSLKNPPGMSLQVLIENPQVVLKPNPNSEKSLIIDLGIIQIGNKRLRTTERVKDPSSLPEGVWVDQYAIMIKDICIFQKEDDHNERQEITLPFDLNVRIEMFGLAQQYSFVDPNNEFDPQMKINVYMAPMIIQLTHTDYMFLMKCLFHNVTYDDGFDNMIKAKYPEHFKAFFLEQRKAAEKQLQQLKEGNQSAGLTFQMDAENLTAFLKNGEPAAPFLRVTLVMFRVQFIKRNNGQADLMINARDLEGSVFFKNNEQYSEKPFMGPMTLHQNYSLEQAQNLKQLISTQKPSISNQRNQMVQLAVQGMLSMENRHNIFTFEDCNIQDDPVPSYKLVVGLNMHPNGDKIIKVDLADFKLMLHAGPLMASLAVIAMDDPDLTPPPAKYVVDQEVDLQPQQPEQPTGGSMNIQVNLNNVIICAPTTIDNNVLAIRGQFLVELQMNPVQTDQQLITSQQDNLLMGLDLTIDGFEICICKAGDLSRQNFKLVRKREILPPLTLKVSLKKLAAPKDRTVIDRTIITTKLSKTELRVCFKDFDLLKAGVDYQTGQLPKAEEKPAEEQKQLEVQKSPEEQKIDADFVAKLKPAEQKIDVDIEGVGVIILNDMGDTFTPILNLELFSLAVAIFKNNIYQTITLSLPLMVTYYNPRASRWEPVIERCQFAIDYYVSNFQGLGPTILTVEQNTSEYPALNINLSTMFFQTVFRAQYLLRKMAEPLKVQRGSSVISRHSIEEEKIQDEAGEAFTQVSPYMVANYTGFQIECEATLQQSLSKSRQQVGQAPPKLVLGNGEQKNISLQEGGADTDVTSNLTQKKVRVTLQLPQGNTLKVEDIDMDRIKAKLHEQQGAKIFTQVKLDPITNSKILSIESNMMFHNLTRQNIVIQIKDKARSVETKLPPKLTDSTVSQTPLPVGFTKASFSLRFAESEGFSDEISIDKLMNIAASADDPNAKAVEVITRDNRYVVVRISDDKDIKGRYKIHLEAPFKITNSLPKHIYVQMLNDHKETTSTFKMHHDSTLENFSHSLYKRAYMRVLVDGFFWSQEHKLYPDKQQSEDIKKDDCIFKMELIDGEDHKMSLLVYEPWRLQTDQRGCREFVIYCTAYVQNVSPYKLVYSTLKEKKSDNHVVIPGQKCINYGDSINQDLILMGPECGQMLALSEPDTPQQYSTHPTSIVGVGACQLDLVREEEGQTKLVYMGGLINLRLCNSQHMLFTKQIQVEPRFIIVNETEFILQFKTVDSHHVAVEIPPNKRVPYQKSAGDNPHHKVDQIYVNMQLAQQQYQWSGNINLASVGLVYFQLRHSDDHNLRAYFSCDTREEGCNVYAIIKHIPSKEAPYKFINKNNAVIFRIPDLKLDLQFENEEDIPTKSTAYYAWDDPSKHDNALKITLDVKGDAKFKTATHLLKVDQIGLEQVFPMKAPNQKTIYIKLSILPEGYQKQIIIDQITEEEVKQKKKKNTLLGVDKKQQLEPIQEEEEEKVNQLEQHDPSSHRSSIATELQISNRINIKINSITLSLIHNSDPKMRPAEYLNLTLRNMEFANISNIEVTSTQLRLQYINIDNNSQFFVNYPVIFTPSKHKLYIIDDKKEKQSEHVEKHFLNVLFTKDNKVKDINLFKDVTLELDPFSINIEEQLITSILEFVSAILTFKNKVEEYEKSLNPQRTGSVMSEESKIVDHQERRDLQQLDRLDHLHWYSQQLPPPSLPTYIDTFIISPINIQLTFQYRGKANDLQSDNMALLKSVFQGLGIALSNIDEAPLNFNGLKLDNSFDTASGLTNKLVQHYKDQAMTQVLKLLGSLSVLGNPVGLFNNISTGVSDLIERPVEGFTKGPLEGGLGLIKGAGSLVQHTIAGAFNSVNKITGSVSSGLQALTMDEDYIREREKMRLQKPKHVGQGLTQAGKSLVTGITEGISGVFFKPFEGAKKDGVKGFFKGALQGVSGLVIKPITGVLDAAAKTTEGIKNTVNYLEDKPNETRMRNVRPFYGPEGYYIEYTLIDAEAYAMINLIKKGVYMNNRFVAAFQLVPVPDEPDNKFIFILTMENMFYMSLKQKKKVWIIQVSDFAHCDKTPKGIRIQTKKPLKALKDKKETELTLGEMERDIIFEQIMSLIRLVEYLR